MINYLTNFVSKVKTQDPETVCQSLCFTEARTVSPSVCLSFAVLVHYRSQTMEDRLEQDRPIFMPTFTYSTLLSLHVKFHYTGLLTLYDSNGNLTYLYDQIWIDRNTVVRVRSPLLPDSRLINLLGLLRCFTSPFTLNLFFGFPKVWNFYISNPKLRESVAHWDIPTTAYRMVTRSRR